MNIQPFTEKHREFAEKNHHLVYVFLNRKKLSETVFYDVVIFGYLKAVQEYCDDPRLHKYKFSTLAWKRMSGSLSNYYKYLSRNKRSALIVSLEEPIESGSKLLWKDIISQQCDTDIEFETELLLHDLATALPEREMRIVRMKAYGEKMHDIAKSEHLTFREINRILLNAYPAIVQILYG